DLEWRLERDVARLRMKHPDGFVVRLHVLGDFYSVEYVKLWGKLLERHPGLHIFGFTARIDGPIFAALVELVKRYGERFAMRSLMRRSRFPFQRRSLLKLRRRDLPTRLFARSKPAGLKAVRPVRCAGKLISVSRSFGIKSRRLLIVCP